MGKLSLISSYLSFVMSKTDNLFIMDTNFIHR
jgi:hypothetical protein